jgi:DegV family protein with EDD domain
MDELDAYLDDLIAHTATYFVVDDLTYLHRGGRISGASKVFGNLLGIKPILYFNEEGKILNIEKKKGIKLALSTLLNYMKTKGSELDKYKIFVMQADCEDLAEKFVEMIKAQFGDVDVNIQPVGPVIGAHCGPGTVGLIFHANEK